MAECRHGLSEDCPGCMQETIDALAAEVAELNVFAQCARKPDEWELAKFLCEKLALEDFDEMSRTKYLGDAKAILEFISAVTSTECGGAK